MAYIGRAPTYGLFQTQSITADSSNTIFNLNYGVSSASSMLVSVGGVVQEPDVAYTVGTGGQTIVFSEAPETGAGVFIIYLGEKYDVPTFANSAVTTAMIADGAITSEKIANGTVIAADVLDGTLSNTKLQLYTVTTDRLSNTGVTAATYGNANIIPSITVDAAGRITSAANSSVTIGSIATSDINNVIFTGRISENSVNIGNSGTAATINLASGTVFTANLTGNATFTLSNAINASSFTLVLTNDGTAGRSVAWSGGTFLFPGGAASLSRTTTANARDVWVFFTPNGGVTWIGNIVMKNLST